MQEAGKFNSSRDITEADRPVSGREYLCVIDIDGEAQYHLATWQEAGDTISLSCGQDAVKDWDRKSPAERILETLSVISTECDEAGFYLVTGDYGLDTGKYPGCTTNPVLIGEEVWYQELPVPPAGLISQEEARKKDDELMRAWEEKQEKEEEKVLEEATREGGIFDRTFRDYPWLKRGWRTLFLGGEPAKELHGNGQVFKYHGNLYPVDERTRNKALLFTLQAIDMFWDAREELGKDREDKAGFFTGMVKEIAKKDEYGIFRFTDRVRYMYLLTRVLALSDCYYRYGWIPDRICAGLVAGRCKDGGKPGKEAMAAALGETVYRLDRLCWMREMSAPDVLTEHAVYRFFEAMYALAAGHSVIPVASDSPGDVAASQA